MSTFLRLNFPLTVSQGFHGELQFPSHGPFPQLFAFFLGNLEESRAGGFGLSEQKLTEACIEESRKHLVHACACVITHTHTTALLSYTTGKNTPPIIQRHLWVLLHPIRSRSWGGQTQKEGKGSHRAADFSHLTPPPSTFSTSLLPSFASPVNAIKRNSMSDPLGTWNAAYKLPAFLGHYCACLSQHCTNNQKATAEKHSLEGRWTWVYILCPGGLPPHNLGCASAKFNFNLPLPKL